MTTPFFDSDAIAERYHDAAILDLARRDPTLWRRMLSDGGVWLVYTATEDGMMVVDSVDPHLDQEAQPEGLVGVDLASEPDRTEVAILQKSRQQGITTAFNESHAADAFRYFAQGLEPQSPPMRALQPWENQAPRVAKRWSVDVWRQFLAEHPAKPLTRQQKLQRAQAQRRRRRKAR